MGSAFRNGRSVLLFVSEAQAYQASWNLADLPKIDVPMPVIQGDADQVLPLDKTGQRLPALIKEMELVVIEGGPHAIPWTHAAQGQHRPARLHPRLTPDPAHTTTQKEEHSCRTTSAPTSSSSRR